MENSMATLDIAHTGYRRRRAICTSLGAGTMALLVFAGTGVGAASTTGIDRSDVPQSSVSYKCTLRNRTQQDITFGEIHKQQGGNTSELRFTPESLLVVGGSASAWQFNNPFYAEYTWGRLCYDHS